MRHRLYGIFYTDAAGRARWGMHRNGRTARRIAKARQAELRAMPLPQAGSWDAPTFRVCSECVIDFTQDGGTR